MTIGVHIICLIIPCLIQHMHRMLMKLRATGTVIQHWPQTLPDLWCKIQGMTVSAACFFRDWMAELLNISLLFFYRAQCSL